MCCIYTSNWSVAGWIEELLTRDQNGVSRLARSVLSTCCTTHEIRALGLPARGHKTVRELDVICICGELRAVVYHIHRRAGYSFERKLAAE